MPSTTPHRQAPRTRPPVPLNPQPRYSNGNVDRAELRQHRFGNQGTSFSCREIGCDVMHPLGRHRWQRTSGGGDACTRIPKDFNDSRADTPCPARNERAAVRELEIKAHGTISRKAIFLRSSRRRNRRSIGLPGKTPGQPACDDGHAVALLSGEWLAGIGVFG